MAGPPSGPICLYHLLRIHWTSFIIIVILFSKLQFSYPTEDFKQRLQKWRNKHTSVLQQRGKAGLGSLWGLLEQVEFMYLPRICFFSTVRFQICYQLLEYTAAARENPKYSLDFYAHLRLCRMSLRPYNQFADESRRGKVRINWKGNTEHKFLFYMMFLPEIKCLFFVLDLCTTKKVHVSLLWLRVSYNRQHCLNLLNLHL